MVDSTKQLSEVISKNTSDIDQLKRQLITQTGSSITRLELFTESIRLEDSGLRIYARDLGSGLVLGHNPKGKLGVNSPQSYLGAAGVGVFVQVGPSGLVI